MRTFMVVLLLSSVALAGCDLLPIFNPPDGDPDELPQPVTMVPAENFLVDDWPRARLELEQAHIRGDVLHLDVAYGGGCQEHDLPLFAADAFAESWPVQARLALAHEDHDDACDAWIQRELRYSLVPLKRACLRQYGRADTTSTVILNVQNLSRPDSVLTLRYTF